MLSTDMLSVESFIVMLRVNTLSVIMLNAIMLSAVAPNNGTIDYFNCHLPLKGIKKIH